jgi:hypothetical protein
MLILEVEWEVLVSPTETSNEVVLESVNGMLSRIAAVHARRD